jgi:curved DNA-binding protein CbpA
MSPDYYELLGCRRGSTAREIKSAYHRLISRFHPDRNPDPRAAEFTARLNEAYSVLSDDRKRVLYDAWIESSQHPKETGESSSSPRAEAPQVKCSRCGRQDETLRLTVMYYVISLFVVTYRRGSSGLWCQKCRIFEAAKWTILSGLLGWWGIPWGPIYTIQALFVNGKGGSQPRSQNAAILRAVGYQLYQQGRLPEAFLALEESLRLEPNVELSSFLTTFASKRQRLVKDALRQSTASP